MDGRWGVTGRAWSRGTTQGGRGPVVSSRPGECLPFQAWAVWQDCDLEGLDSCYVCLPLHSSLLPLLHTHSTSRRSVLHGRTPSPSTRESRDSGEHNRAPPPGSSPLFCPAPHQPPGKRKVSLDYLTLTALFHYLSPNPLLPAPGTAAGPAPASPSSCPDPAGPSGTCSSSPGLPCVGPALSGLPEALDPSPAFHPQPPHHQSWPVPCCPLQLCVLTLRLPDAPQGPAHTHPPWMAVGWSPG